MTFNFPKVKGVFCGLLVIFLITGCGKISGTGEENANNPTNKTNPETVSETPAPEYSDENDYDVATIIDTVKKYVDKSNFYAKRKIDYSQYEICTVKKLLEEDKGAMDSISLVDSNYTIQDNDLFVIVGDTTSQDFVALVIVHTTLEVKGYFPTK